MPNFLQITNGDAVQLKQTGLDGAVVFWRGVLDEGPAPAGLTLDRINAVRARFLTHYGVHADAP